MSSRERRIKFDGRNFEFLSPMFVNQLEKINNAIEELKKSDLDEVQISLNLTELTTFRRFLVMDKINVEMCRDSILEGMEHRKL